MSKQVDPRCRIGSRRASRGGNRAGFPYRWLAGEGLNLGFLQPGCRGAHCFCVVGSVMGVTGVRVWVGRGEWEEIGSEMGNRFELLLAPAQHLDRSVVPCIFDSCGVEPSTVTTDVVKLPEAYARAMKHPNTNDASRER